MADRQGFLVKEGGNIKTWKKRWFVLKAGSLMYHKKMNGSELGIVPLTIITNVQQSNYKKKKSCMEIHTPERIYYMCAGSDADRDGWINALNIAKKSMEKVKETTSTTNGNGANAGAVSYEDRISIKDFDLLNVVGKGSFGKVMQVRKKDNGKIYAMKVLNKQTILDRGELAHTKAEKNILQKLVHPFLVNLIYAFQTSDKLYFIMDYINGGELFFHLQKEEKFTDERVQFYCAEIVCGLEYLHACGVLYRDLKPENILLTDDGHICMTDFGISKEGLISSDDRTATFCGTPEYLAPEILQGKSYGKAVDWWSFGTLMYEMLTGLPPFYSQDVQDMYNKIMHDKLVFPPQVSQEARSLLTALLERSPEKRLQDPKSIKSHPYFKGMDWDKVVRKEIDPPFVPDVKGKADTSQVDTEFLAETPKLSVDKDSNLSSTLQQNFAGFTFVNSSEHLM
jgi:RAC serine/threonine-protein kinase